MSNAEEKSSKTSTDMLPLLRERNRSLTTFRRAVSVLFDCEPILMLLCIMPYIMLDFLMSFAALSYAVCYAFFFLKMIFVFMLRLGLLTHSLFISSTFFHDAQCF